ncbi:hypothetical protein BB8028_0009g00700 [Beauveria bassiana]|uniref:Uncharacterized protein n=1 Tax=Beauveria bassiana TaxID=176275 RepID=A0A2S7YP07_BEABA|nr:hypothetical protein BB8028_0009g00700 [Beauveria bassiana]
MSKPVAELIEATESFHLSDGLCKNWEQKEEGGSDSVNRYFAALPDAHTYCQSIGVPSHLPLKDGLMQGHGYATIPWEERANITDPRVGTSTGHIPVYTRPPRVCLGWGGYDEFLSWQEAGRAVHKDMVKEEKWNLLRDTTARFVNKEGKVVSVVPNNIPKEHFPHRPEDPVPLFDLLHGRRGGSQRGPETAEGVHNSQVSTAEKDSEHVDHVKSGELN